MEAKIKLKKFPSLWHPLFFPLLLNPFATTGSTGTSKSKVKVMVICLNISFMTIYQFFHSYMKKSSKSLLKKKKGLLIYLSSIKTELAINFLKILLHLDKNRAGAERVNSFSTTRGYKHHQNKVKVKGLGRKSPY